MTMNEDLPVEHAAANWLREQLPAAEVRVNDDPTQDAVKIEARFKAHGIVTGVDVIHLPAQGVEAHLEQIVRKVRLEAFVNYGLQAEIDIQLAEARQDAARDVVRELERRLDDTLETNREESGMLPPALAVAADWLRIELKRIR